MGNDGVPIRSQVRTDSPRRCTERVEVFLVGHAATDPVLAEAREILVERFRAVNAEDIGVIEGLQHAFETTAWDGGHFTPYLDGPVHRYQRLIAAAVAG